MAWMAGAVTRVSGFARTATRRTRGNASLSNSSRFAASLGNEERVAGDVAARPREARNEAKPHGIADIGYDDRYRIRCGCLLRGEGARDRVRHDDIDLEPNELGRECGKTIVLTFCKAILDDDVLAIDVTQVAKSRSKGIDAGGPCCRRGHAQEPDPRDGRAPAAGRAPIAALPRAHPPRLETACVELCSSPLPGEPAGKVTHWHTSEGGHVARCS